MPEDHDSKGETLKLDCGFFQPLTDEAQILPTATSTQSPISYSSEELHTKHDVERSKMASVAMPRSQKVRWEDDAESASRHDERKEYRCEPPPNNQLSGSGRSPPPRKDSAYFSVNGWDDEGSEIDAEIQARQMHARERVEILRGRLSRTRHLIQTRRRKLRELRESARDSSALLMRRVEEIIALDDLRNLRALTPIYEECRRIQDELGPAEEEQNILELRLNDEEQELEQEEDHFYRHYNVSIGHLPETKLDEILSPLVKPYEPPESEFESLDLAHELVQEYHEKVTEAENLKDELEELEGEYAHLNEDAAFRKRHNINVSRQTAEFLADYPETYKETVARLRVTEDQLFDIRHKCIDEKLFSDTDHVYEPHDAFRNDLLDAVDDALDRSPLLASSPETFYFGHKTLNFSDKREYVNNWLLGWAQNCKMEALQLRAWIYFEYPGPEKKIAEDDWPSLALAMWNKDDAGANTDASYEMSRIDAIYGGTGRPGFTKSGFSSSFPSLGSLSVDFGDEGLEEIIMGGGTDSFATREDDEAVPMIKP